jgi:hypothetical protein
LLNQFTFTTIDVTGTDVHKEFGNHLRRKAGDVDEVWYAIT